VHYQVKQEGTADIGYIQLDSFSSNSPVQMQKAIQSLLAQQVDGFVLDLRDNGGGSLQAAIEISRMWLDRGTIVQTVDREGKRDSISANQTALTQLPLAILVNGQSASASEILTGAMMDHQRATVVGTQTYGKALVQQLHPLSDGSALTVTIAHYYTPNGTDISHRGITPNVVANVTDAEQQQLASNAALRGAAMDSQYQRAIDTLEARASLRQSS
jgi:carboxyl-terminal processing protease